MFACRNDPGSRPLEGRARSYSATALFSSGCVACIANYFSDHPKQPVLFWQRRAGTTL